MSFFMNKENSLEFRAIPYGTKIIMHDTKTNTAFEGKIVGGRLSYSWGWNYRIQTPYGEVESNKLLSSIKLYVNESELAKRTPSTIFELGQRLGSLVSICELLADYNMNTEVLTFEFGTYDKKCLGAIYVYVYNNGKAQKVNILRGDGDYVSFDKEGFSIHVTLLERNPNWYHTEEECMADNQPTIVRLADNDDDVKPSPLIDESNSHDKKLVDKINNTYYKHTSQLRAIMSSFAIRDKEELEDNGVYIPNLMKCSKEDVYNFAIEYFMNFADDEDLKCVLHFFNE